MQIGRGKRRQCISVARLSPDLGVIKKATMKLPPASVSGYLDISARYFTSVITRCLSSYHISSTISCSGPMQKSFSPSRTRPGVILESDSMEMYDKGVEQMLKRWRIREQDVRYRRKHLYLISRPACVLHEEQFIKFILIPRGNAKMA